MPLLLELSSITIFGFYLHHAWKNKNLKFLLSAFILALLVEDVFVSLFSHEAGGYVYSDKFLLVLHNTPIFIVFFWASIIYASYFYLKKLKLLKSLKFLMPLSVLSLDVIMDVVAVELGLWTWFGFEEYNGFLSIPPSNYLAWLLLPFAFVITWEYFEKSKYRYLQPFFAFLFFLFLNIPLFFIKKGTCDTSLAGQWGIFLGVLSLFIFASIYFHKSHKTQHTIFSKIELFQLYLVRFFIHLFSLIGIIYLGLYSDISIILVFSAIILFEIYLFKKI